MFLHKNLQTKNFNCYQAKTSFKYLLLSSLKTFNSSLHYSHKPVFDTATNKSNKLLNSLYKLRLLAFHLKKSLHESFSKPTRLQLQYEKIKPIQTLTHNSYLGKQNKPNLVSCYGLFFANTLSKKISLVVSLFKSQLANSSIIKNNLVKFKCINNRFDYAKLKLMMINRKKEFVGQLAQLFKKLNFRFEFVRVSLKKNTKSYFASFSAAGLFTWDEYRVKDEDIKREVNEILSLFSFDHAHDHQIAQTRSKIDFEKTRLVKSEEWKLIYDKKDLIIWRRNIKEPCDVDSNLKTADYDLYEYKVLGRFNDVTPMEFFQTQVDLHFRKEWDHLVINLDLLDVDPTTKTELLQWIMRFPYPLYPREYIFVRRYCVDPKQRLLLLISKSIPESRYTPQPDPHKKQHQYVRVSTFKSNIIVMPHHDFDRPGIDYVIQYYDVNKAKIPKLAYNWMAASGLPDFVEKVHRATHKLKHKNQENEKLHGKPKDVLAKYELFDLNERPAEIKPVEVAENLAEPEVKVKQAEPEVVDVHKAAELNVNGPEDKKEGDKKTDKLSKENEIVKKNDLKYYYVVVVEKLYSDYFSEHEPHPLFNNF